MLKYILYFIIVATVIGGIIGIVHLYRVSVRNEKEMAPYMNMSDTVHKNFGKTLIIYYSLTGHTKEIAEKIQSKTNADLFEIETQKAFPMKPILFFAVKQQLKDKNYPALKNIPDITAYDTIFIGAPVWWYTAATPVLSLLNQVDFQNKKVVPFSTQGSNAGTFLEDFKAKIKNAVVLDYASFNNIGKEYDQAVNAKIAAWLNNL